MKDKFSTIHMHLMAGNSEASDDGVMAALALFDSADASKPDPSPRWFDLLFWNSVLIFHLRSHLEESDSEIEAIEPEAEGNFKNDRSMMSEEGEEEEEEDENYEGEGEEEEEEDEDEEEEEDEGPPKPVKQPCILVFDSLGGKKDRQARNLFLPPNIINVFIVFTSRRDCVRPSETS